jgi:hypothetical protein
VLSAKQELSFALELLHSFIISFHNGALQLFNQAFMRLQIRMREQTARSSIRLMLKRNQSAQNEIFLIKAKE